MNRVRGHPNVCEILGWKKITTRVYALVMKYYVECSVTTSIFGNLFLTSQYMHGILSGMKHLKDRGVCHRDIARENVLWNPVTQTAVITDFDTACVSRRRGYYRNVGRDDYDAPEKTAVIKFRDGQLEDLVERRRRHRTHREYHAYTDSADIYSAGVILWMLLNNTSSSPTPDKLKSWTHKMKKKKKHRSHIELDLLSRMLEFNPRARITLEEALEHPFLNSTGMDAECRTLYDHLYTGLNIEIEIEEHSEHSEEDSEEHSEHSEEEDNSALVSN